ncbi:MAG TPA: tetratricopeptide repeat protein [Kofleriaceae bacterium]|nr:tetratricopeptide repeat protein [Kofleriaceae bacterium]
MARRTADDGPDGRDELADDPGAAPTLRADPAAFTPGLGSFDSLFEAIAATPEVSPSLILEAGAVIAGNYRVIEQLGIGGMGVVYLATDLTLGRKVAIKLHRRVETESGTARLLREAQAMARLSHPNVITVHQVGTFKTHVFIAMAYVPGGTLRRWLQQRPQPAAIISMFAQAGRGLAAAHAAGLVHRDIKPDNILLTQDGRALVGDFGLAQAADWSPDDEGPAASSSSDLRLTATGARMGTPAYMAPEQHRGEQVDAAADQFSFCVALHEALYGELPYPGRTPAEIAEAMQRGVLALRPIPGVPARVRQALQRGLAIDPAARFRDMGALLASLDLTARPARWPWLAVAASILLLGGAGLALHTLARPAADPCREAGARTANTWSAEARGRVEARLTSLDVPYAGTVWQQIDTRLRAYSTELGAQLVEACREARRPDSAELGARRRECLQQRGDHLRAVVRTLEAADVTVAEHAVTVTTGLPPIAACEDTAYLLARVKPPADPVDAAAVDAFRAQLAEAQVKLESGLAAAGDQLAEQVIDGARRLRYEPLVAEGLLARGNLERAADRYADAEKTLTEAFFTARRSGADETAAQAAVSLVWVLGHDGARLTEAETWASHAESDIARLGGDPRLRGRVIGARALIAEMHGRYDEALALRKQVYDLLAPILGPDDPMTAQALNSVGVLHDLRGEYTEAVAYYGRAVATLERIYGPDHPALGSSLSNLGLVTSARGDYALAETQQRRALDLALRYQGPDHIETAYAHLNLGVSISRAGQHDAAIIEYDRALAIIEAKLGPEHPDAALCLNSLAVAYEIKKDFDRSLEYHRRALTVMESSVGPEHPHAAIVRTNIASVLIKLERLDEAVDALQRARETWEKQGEAGADMSLILSLLGEARLLQGNARQAVPLLERARALAEEQEVQLNDRARISFLLAKALWRTGQRGARPRELAGQAATLYDQRGPDDAHLSAEVRAWLRTLGPP